MKRAHALENLARHLDAVAFPFHANLAMPRQHLDTQGIANLPQMLVSTAENSELFGVSIQIDRDFRHAPPLADPGEPQASATLIVAPGPRLTLPHNPTIIMLSNRGKKQHSEKAIKRLLQTSLQKAIRIPERLSNNVLHPSLEAR